MANSEFASMLSALLPPELLLIRFKPRVPSNRSISKCFTRLDGDNAPISSWFRATACCRRALFLASNCILAVSCSIDMVLNLCKIVTQFCTTLGKEAYEYA